MPFWLVSAASALLLTALCVVLWTRRPPQPLWPIALACQLFALIWVIGDLWSSHATGMTEKEVALAVLFTGSIALPPLWFETSRRYVVWLGLSRPWMLSPWARLPLAFAALAWVFMLANPWHGQFIGPVVGGPNRYEWGVSVVAWTLWGVTLATSALCAWAAFRHTKRRVRRKMATLSLATLAPLVTNFIHAHLPDGPRVDPVAIGLALTSLVVIHGITSSRLFDLAPVALHELLRRDPTGVLLLDDEGRLLLWNPAAEKLFEGVSFEPDLPVVQVLSDWLREDEATDSDHSLWDELANPSGPRLYRYLAGGDDAWRRVTVTPLPPRGAGRAAACLRVEDATREVRDARESRGRRERLHSAATAHTLAAVADGVAHDFNNVLATIAGRAHLALATTRPGDPLHVDLSAIVNATNLARDLTNQLLSRSGGATAHREAVDASALVLDLVAVLRDSLPPSVALDLDLAERLPCAEVDPTQIQQVVLNLVKNAGEAIGDREGSVIVRTREVEAGGGTPAVLLIEVTDTGPGFGPVERERAFEPFFTTRGEGRGLGLALVARIVEAHSGSVELESRRGAGSRVSVRIPFASA